MTEKNLRMLRPVGNMGCLLGITVPFSQVFLGDLSLSPD